MESFIFCAANPSKLQNGLVRALEIHKTPLWIKIASYSYPGKENKRKLKKIIEKDHKLNIGQKLFTIDRETNSETGFII